MKMKAFFRIVLGIAFIGRHGVVTAFKRITQMGACEHQETQELRCVIQPSDCKPTHINGANNVEGEKFLSVHQQRLQQRDLGCMCVDTPAHLCLTPNVDDPSRFTKTCVSDVSSCDISSGSLLGASADADQHCTCAHVREDDNKILGPTLYGACKNTSKDDDFFCAFQPSDCETPYVWVNPRDTEDVVGTQCTCDKVRTGACVSGFFSSGSLCATTPSACGAGFMKPMSLKEKYGESCRLCDTIFPDEDEVPPDAIDAAEKQFGLWPILFASLGGAIVLLAVAMYCILEAKRRKGTMKIDIAGEETRGTELEEEISPTLA